MYQTHKYSFFQFLQRRTQAFFSSSFFQACRRTMRVPQCLPWERQISPCSFQIQAAGSSPERQHCTNHNTHRHNAHRHNKPSQQTVSLHKLHAQCYCNDHQACYCTTTRNDITTQPQRYRGWPLSTGDYKFCIHGWWYATEGKIYIFYYRHVNSPQKNRAFRNMLQPMFAD